MEIKLRKLEMSDAERVYGLFANDNVLKDLDFEMKASEFNLEEEKKWIEKILLDYKRKHPKSFDMGIILDGELIGVIGAKDIDWKNENTEIGYWLGEDYWSQGHMPEAIKKFVKYLFKKFKFKRIEGLPFAYNKASQKVLEKAGFKREGIRRKAIKKGNKFLDDVLYARVRG